MTKNNSVDEISIGYNNVFISNTSNTKFLGLLTCLFHAAQSFLRSELALQLVKKFPAFFGTRRFITVLTSAGHLSLL
jgi:hypothetical protein